MSCLATVVEQFRSRYSQQCEQPENSTSLDLTGCSQRSQCSQQVSESKSAVMQFVSNACVGLADPQKVIDHLLSTTDEQDILDGLTPKTMLRAHIQLWLQQGMRYYSGKK